MAIERKFIQEQIKKLRVDLYVHKELERVGCGKVEVKRTPLGSRIIIHASKPGLVIGRKGKNIEILTNTLKNRFKIDNPQIEVQEIAKPNLDPEIMVKQLASTLERGIHFRRAAYSMVKQIMGSGALGVEIDISGKVSGDRRRTEKFKDGYIKYCGETALKYVKIAKTQAKLKAGVFGIKVKITPPATGLSRFDELRLLEPKPKEEKQEAKSAEKREPEAAKAEPAKRTEPVKKAELEKRGEKKTENAPVEKKEEKKREIIKKEEAQAGQAGHKPEEKKAKAPKAKKEENLNGDNKKQ